MPGLKDSKIGGTPYFPAGYDYPHTSKNLPMALFVQINLDGISLPDFPSHGILEAFVDNNIDYPTEYKILYFEDTEKEQSKSIPQDIDLSNFFVQEPIKIKLKKATTVMPVSDYRFDKILAESAKNNLNIDIANLYDIEDVSDISIDDIIDELDTPSGNLGGYADFTQTDPREFGEHSDYSECLLKIDSVLDDRIEIGDCGIAWILIKKEDLLNKHFENGLFDWDCC